MDLGDRATVSLLSGPFFLDGKRVFDGSDGPIGIPSKDDPARVGHCYRGVCPLISRHFSQDLWKQPPRTLENIILHKHRKSRPLARNSIPCRQILLFYLFYFLCVLMKSLRFCPHLTVLDFLQSRVRSHSQNALAV